jgi:methylthioribose-1-phosphate isomerase
VNNLEEYQIELKKGGSSSWVPSNIAYYNPAFDSNGVKLNLGIINDSISKVM